MRLYILHYYHHTINYYGAAKTLVIDIEEVLVTIEYKLILAALIYSEQVLLSIEAQLCTRRECKTFLPRRPLSVQCIKYVVLFIYSRKYPEAKRRLLPWNQAFYHGNWRK